ncbi:rho GTPase-activating protein 6 isoform X2 [Drosophila ficusphila]|nr:rho GTPase-activating protein 6 isoform X2 [Drosophila ficusphila]
MQKSKSLSNVGQFMTKKIWGSRSKSQNRRNPAKDCSHLPALKWYPSTNCLWVSESGENFQIAETSLVKLSKTESDLLKDFALEKIKEFNIANVEDLKKLSQKRQIVQKKKSMTTTFFDVGRKYERNGGSLRLFGASLESCLARDLKRSDDIDNRSKYSLMSVFRGGGSNPGSIMKLNDNVRSCESLPSKSLEYGYVESSESLSDSNTSVSKRSTSQSQFESENSELSLDKHYQDQKILMVPKFVNQCIDYLEENGLHKVGIFRVSTSKKRVMQLREEFDKSSNLMISADTCPHDVATLLKEFLRDLPEPLLCDKLYSTFLKTQRIRNRRLQLEAISHLIRLLPIPNRDTLYVLLVFLAKVAAHCDDTWSTDKNCLMVGNKMDSNNLATVFAPNILRSTFLVLPSNREEENISDAINVIRILIDHYKEIFKISPELLNCIYTQVLEICPEKLYELISTKINSHEWYENIDHSSDIDLMIEKCPGAESQIKTGHTNDVMGSREQNLQVLSASLKISLPEQAQTNVKANLKNQENKTSCQKLSKIPAIPSDPGSTTLSANTAQFEKNVVSNSSNNFGNIGNCQTGAPKKHTYKRQHLISSSRRISQGP